jgi:hypothetical protein
MTILVYTCEFETPTECVSHLFECGAELSDQRLEQAPSGRWRGSGAVNTRRYRAMMFCQHANESPRGACRCPGNCGCRERMCR